jgi:hypothetical protein
MIHPIFFFEARVFDFIGEMREEIFDVASVARL